MGGGWPLPKTMSVWSFLDLGGNFTLKSAGMVDEKSII